MKKGLIIISVIGFVLISGIIFYFESSHDNFNSENNLSANNSQPSNLLTNKSEPEMENEGIALSIPFSKENIADNLIPMGETINHPESENPGGHPGIDFQWTRDKPPKVYASAPGEIIWIEKSDFHDTIDVFVETGEFAVGYTELAKVNPELSEGDFVERGEFIGELYHFPETHEGFYGFHWEFGYTRGGLFGSVPHPKRLCPMSYFDNESRGIIEKIWENGWEHKEEFPYVCSGYYYGRDE